MFYKQTLLATLLATTTLSAIAVERPLAVYNQGALARSTELPVLGETSVLDHGASISSLRFDLSSEYHTSDNINEAVVLDGESDLFTLAFRRGFGQGLEWTLELPLLHQGGGFMDAAIEGWHKTFSLPDGRRSEARDNQFRYQYQRDGELLLDQRDTGWDFGDVRTGLGWRLSEGLALRGEAKFASGKESHLAGGNNGGALWLDWALPFFEEASPWSGFASAGASYNAQSDVLADQQKRFVPFAAAGLAARLADRLFLLSQLYAHGKLYGDSDLNPFRPSAQFSLGLRYRVSPQMDVDVGFQEDPVVAASPDFSLHLALSWRGQSPGASP